MTKLDWNKARNWSSDAARAVVPVGDGLTRDNEVVAAEPLDPAKSRLTNGDLSRLRRKADTKAEEAREQAKVGAVEFFRAEQARLDAEMKNNR
jgi:hypothetical protein